MFDQSTARGEGDDSMAFEMISAPVEDSELKIFNNIVDLNWAWLYQKDTGKWTQFECLNCMILESKWQQWKED